VRDETVHRSLAVSSAPVVPPWWDSTEVGGDHDDILTSATAEDERGRITISLAERRPVAVQGLSIANDTDDFFYAPGGKCAHTWSLSEIREDSEASPRAGAFRRSKDEHGVVGERSDNRGGRE